MNLKLLLLLLLFSPIFGILIRIALIFSLSKMHAPLTQSEWDVVHSQFQQQKQRVLRRLNFVIKAAINFKRGITMDACVGDLSKIYAKFIAFSFIKVRIRVLIKEIQFLQTLISLALYLKWAPFEILKLEMIFVWEIARQNVLHKCSPNNLRRFGWNFQEFKRLDKTIENFKLWCCRCVLPAILAWIT